MKLRRVDSTRIVYIIIALLCLANFFLGVKVIRKLTNNKTEGNSEKFMEEEVIEVFSNETTTDYVDKSQLEMLNENIKVEEENIYVRLLSSSNAYMEHVYDIQLGDNKLEGFKGLWTKVALFFEPKSYLRSQFPAIFGALDTTAASGNDIEYVDDKEDSNVVILEDIVFIEDPTENNEGQELLEFDETDIDKIQAPNPINLNHENPYILIYHTHGTESYLPAKADNYHTDKREYNVITIGEMIGNKLSENGHKVKHVDIYHDIPSYNQSYPRSLSTLKDELSKNKDIKIVFDIHRDGVEEDASYLEKAKDEARININGKDVATFFMVIGPDNPNKDELIKFANYIKSVSDKMYPGLCKGIVIKPLGKFNQYMSDYYALIEVGSNLNTIDEAKESAQLVGEILNEVIEGIKEN